jgi:methylated-DNA-protein-cysteine methyltransferase related protein
MEKYSLYEHFYEIIGDIPKGKVATYGDIAKIADCRSARAVGFALNRLPENSLVPWQRVINGQGKVSTRQNSEGDSLQQQILEEEGVEFINGIVDLRRFRWQNV